MNWTGGRLRRHSSRPGTLTKNQRESLSKPRQVTHRVPAAAVPFPGFAALPFQSQEHVHAAEPNQSIYHYDGVPKTCSPRDCTNLDASPRSKVNDANASQLKADSRPAPKKPGVLKHALLQQTDWANLSLARPLDINFASTEERERFGKRRKLTDSDRQRLSLDNATRTLPGYFPCHKIGVDSSQQDIGHIQVHINGQPAGSHPRDKGDNQAPNTLPSSHPMLLDDEGVISPFQSSLPGSQKLPQLTPWNLASYRLSLPPSHNRAPLRMQEPQPTTKDDMIETSNSLDTRLSQNLDSAENYMKDSMHHTQMEPIQSPSPASPYRNTHNSPLENHHHSTLGGQLFAKQLQLNITPFSCQQSPRDSSRSPYGISAPSPTLILANAPSVPSVPTTPNAADIPDASNGTKSFSWLPSLRPLPSFRSPMNTRGRNLQQAAVHETPNTVPPSPSLNVTKATTNPAAVEIFGQIVQLEGGNNFKFS
ncbi:hypothetical protein N7478_001832 [Penicillium angulare]|uniref:uncharacterized protein n=1 Tax=Penicillium angulare TaxID=116970 RepID=UPI002541B96A|nr:uncharacterized protein N7478_001832 [Penicillium angulare]KAJ5288802.1 hypothetical protein N7478_001832 [Penicillium angulare]